MREIDRQRKRHTWFSIFHIPEPEETTICGRGRKGDRLRKKQTKEETYLVLHLPDASRDHDLLEDGSLDAEYLPLLYSLMDKHHYYYHLNTSRKGYSLQPIFVHRESPNN